MNVRTTALALGLLALLALPTTAQERRGKRFSRGHNGGRIEYGARRVWVPGHHERTFERVWIAGHQRQVWVPARYEWRTLHHGQRQRVLVHRGYYRTVRSAGRWERRAHRAWVAGHYEYR